MRIFLCFLFVLGVTITKAQIVGPDTVIVNTPTVFSTPAISDNYAWSTTNLNISLSSKIHRSIFSSNFYFTTHPVMRYENGNYIGFILRAAGELYKLNFGTSPNNIPVYNTLGPFASSVAMSNAQGLDLIQDGNNWYGFITNGGYLIRLNFGTSLNNIPTSTIMDFSADLNYSTQIVVKRVSNTEVYAFTTDVTLHKIVRFDFGGSLTNTPTLTNIGGPADFNRPCNLTLYEENSSWYMLVSNVFNDTISFLNFGSSLANNTPNISGIGNPGNLLNAPRTISLFPDCNNLYGVVLNEWGPVVKLDFNGSITNVPTASTLTTIPNISGLKAGYPYWYNDTLFMMITNSNSSDCRFIDLYTLPANSTHQTGFNLPSFVHSFAIPGTHEITLQLDQGLPTGPATFCKTVVVKNPSTSADDISLNDIKFSPNPTNGILEISGTGINGAEAELKCISMNGTTVWQNKIKLSSVFRTNMDISNLPKGFYCVILTISDKHYNKTIILQ